MMRPTYARIGFVRLGDSDYVPANPEDDLRGKDVYSPEGQRAENVEDLYIDLQELEARFLRVGSGGFLGIGENRFLVPVEAVVEVAEGWVAIEPGRMNRVDGPAPFDTTVAPPPADDRSGNVGNRDEILRAPSFVFPDGISMGIKRRTARVEV